MFFFYDRDCECNDCGREFIQAFGGKKPATLKVCFIRCPFCPGDAVTVDGNAQRRVRPPLIQPPQST